MARGGQLGTWGFPRWRRAREWWGARRAAAGPSSSCWGPQLTGGGTLASHLRLGRRCACECKRRRQPSRPVPPSGHGARPWPPPPRGSDPTRPGTRSARLRRPGGRGAVRRGGARQRNLPPIGRVQCLGRGAGRRRVSGLRQAEAGTRRRDRLLSAAEGAVGCRATRRHGDACRRGRGRPGLCWASATGTAIRSLGSDHFSEGLLTSPCGAFASGRGKEGEAGAPHKVR